MHKVNKFPVVLFCLFVARAVFGGSIYSTTTQKGYSSYLEYQNGVYDVTFSFQLEYNRLILDSAVRRELDLFPTYGKTIPVSDGLDFHLPRIELDGQLYQADIEYLSEIDAFSVANVAYLGEQN